jgi:hypothetical protein
MGIYSQKAKQIGELVESKNAAYGNSFEVSGEMLRELWPDGIPVASYTDVACVVRILDKLKRIATNKDYNGESPYVDIGGYGVLGAVKDDRIRSILDEANDRLRKAIEERENPEETGP